MPYGVSNPVKFYAGGDTTSQAIGKHIAEFARVYDILNSIGSGKAVIVTFEDVVLKAGEIGFKRDTRTLKVGDGSTRWRDLPGINVVEVVDNLLSDEATKALSAAQGKALKALIDGIPKTEVVDDLTTGGSGKALSAEQGKALKTLIDTLTTPVPGPPGPKGIEWRGAWDGTAEYRKDDAVSYHGGSYIALKPSTGEPPSNAEFWNVLSAKGADGAGAGDMTKADYDTDGDGKVDAAVMADMAKVVAWDNVTGKPEKFTCDIIDALDSDRTDAALSAKQGKALNTLIGEVKASVPETFLRVIKDTTQPGFFTVPGTAQDVWFVRVYCSEVVIPGTLGVPISFYRAPTDSVGLYRAIGAGVLIPGGTKLSNQMLVQTALIPHDWLSDVKALIFMGEKVNLS